ncbi:AgmX/PglI C-terminal domain-containing protein [Myxococcota bacterium]|nr:AgmX/PglI C-terminal domain-containing protein [Myxococcota bacterium]MBU1898451.1 AgmX/PglI C-terminal domain-containing protein [Myxococcota bacterium]
MELVHAPLEPTPPLDALPVEEEEDSGAPRMVWSTDVEGIRGAMRESIPEIKACYEAWVKAYPEMEGRLIASFTISADPEEDRGLVSEVAILDSELKHKMMEGCVLDVVSELRFVAPSGGPLTVRYPFNFAVPAEP